PTDKHQSTHRTWTPMAPPDEHGTRRKCGPFPRSGHPAPISSFHFITTAPATRKGRRQGGAGQTIQPFARLQEEALSTVTARRFCDQQEMSLQTATGRSLP